MISLSNQFEPTVYLAWSSRRGASKILSHDLTFWGHRHWLWPLDLQYMVSCRWSVETNHLSHTVVEVWGLKDFGVTTLTFWGHVIIGLARQPNISQGCQDMCQTFSWYSHWKCIDPHFYVLGAKQVVVAFFSFGHSGPKMHRVEVGELCSLASYGTLTTTCGVFSRVTI